MGIRPLIHVRVEPSQYRHWLAVTKLQRHRTYQRMNARCFAHFGLLFLAFGLGVFPLWGTDLKQPGNKFTNSLGMPFVGFGGSNKLICVWETRNSDYLLFVEATKRTWQEPWYGVLGPSHPVVKVSWEDAQAFCAWLTEKERAEERIGTNWAYRLPTDLEWGKALGLRHERGKSPVERFFYGGPALPWGEVWPPPLGIANLGHSLGIDEWEHTSPVGSFAPNRFGIFDMVGNVAEWCEDLYEPNDSTRSTERTIRGSSFVTIHRGACAASVRLPRHFSDRIAYVGFRCVLAETRNSESDEKPNMDSE